MDSTNEKMIPVFDVEDQAQEALVRTALEEAGIHFLMTEPDGTEVLQIEPFHQHSKVFVLEHETEKAKQIIESTIGGNA